MAYRKFHKLIGDIEWEFKEEGKKVHTEKWQAVDIGDNPAAQMVEILHHSFHYDISNDIENLKKAIKPNLPWAENHFQERICGEPINPGVEWANWPWGNSADNHRDQNGQFNHNYMERYWPKYAGFTGDGKLSKGFEFEDDVGANYGIRHEYGDLGNLINLLIKEPTTRQAYLPIWFPEDTGDVHGGRKPCTLGYHFIVRDGEIDITYYIRSCDYVRHFRDDVYLTIRLLHHVLEECRKANPVQWRDIKPGKLVMHITSLHIFINDYINLFGEAPNGK